MTERISRLDVPTRVLMLSMHASPEFAARALAAGAAGYLNKDSAFDELATALDVICSGKRYLCRALDADAMQKLEAARGVGGAGQEDCDESRGYGESHFGVGSGNMQF